MKDQHTLIKGYRDLSQPEIDMMNKIKEKASEVGVLIDCLESFQNIDQRWVAVAKTQLQQGFMAAVRSVAQPSTF